mgnify:CR=1 FL=1
MIISIIVAMDKKGVIGKEDKIPWHLPRDLKRFRKLTIGKPVIMGRRTFESIGRPLDGRINIVLTRNLKWKKQGVIVVHSVKEAIKKAKENSPEAREIMIIGGAEIYRQFLPITHRLYLTIVEGEFEGDVYFPELDNEEWKEICREYYPPDQNNTYAHSFIILERKSKAP